MRWRMAKGRSHPCPSQWQAITRVLFPKWRIQQPAIAQDANHPVPHWGHRLIKNAEHY
jgi:hypothetical protein